MRVHLDVPDDADPQRVAEVVAGVQDQIGGRPAMIMLRRPAGLTDEEVAVLVARCAALLNGAAQVRASLN